MEEKKPKKYVCKAERQEFDSLWAYWKHELSGKHEPMKK